MWYLLGGECFGVSFADELEEWIDLIKVDEIFDRGRNFLGVEGKVCVE